MTDNNFYDNLAEGEYVDKLFAKIITNMIFNDETPLKFIRIDGTNSSKFIILKKQLLVARQILSRFFTLQNFQRQMRKII